MRWSRGHKTGRTARRSEVSGEAWRPRYSICRPNALAVVVQSRCRPPDKQTGYVDNNNCYYLRIASSATVPADAHRRIGARPLPVVPLFCTGHSARAVLW